MARPLSRVPPLALAVLLLLPLNSRAEDAAAPVTGSGRVTIKRLPNVLRAQVILTGQAKDPAGAVAKLKDAKTNATRKLAELGAAEKSIEFGPIRQGGVPPDPRTQYQQYMQEMQRAMQQGGAPAAPAKSGVVLISATCTAEWLITAAGEEELFVAGLALQEKIKSAGIGKPEAKNLTPAEAEAAEEERLKGGGAEPTFTYVSHVSKADKAAARAEAFQKAKQDAAAMAKAAGGELGTLRQITSSAISPTAGEGGEQAMSSYMQQLMGNAITAAALEPDTDEATAKGPMPVTLRISVTAAFSLREVSAGRK